MRALNNILIKNLALNKKRTLSTIVGITLSVLLICALSTIFTSLRKTLLQNEIEETGYFHLQLKQIPEEEVEILKRNRDVKEIKNIYHMGYALINNESEEETANQGIDISFKRKNYFHFLSTEDFEKLSFKVIDGRLPQNRNELVISRDAFLELDYQIGDYVSFEIGQLKEETDEYGSSILLGLEKKKTKKYKIVGVVSRNFYSNDIYYGVTTKEKSQLIDTYLALSNPKNYRKVIPELVGLPDYQKVENHELAPRYNYEVNTGILLFESFDLENPTVRLFYSILGVILFIVSLTAILCIRNSFAISILERTKMYGMLSSIGATKKQIKKNVIFEGLMLGLIGIPIGILLGTFGSILLIKIIGPLLQNYLFHQVDEMVFDISFFPILLSIILGFSVIYCSVIVSAKRASKISPIENLKGIYVNNQKFQKKKTPRIVSKLWKTEGILAYKNIERCKKKYRTTVISLTISIFLFVMMGSFLRQSLQKVNNQYKNIDYDISVSKLEKITKEDFQKIQTIKEIEESNLFYRGTEKNPSILKIYDLEKLEKQRTISLVKDANCTYDETTGKGTCTGGFVDLNIWALEKETFKRYMKKLGIDSTKVKDQAILYDHMIEYYDDKFHSVRAFQYQQGDLIQGFYNNQSLTIELFAITDLSPFGRNSGYHLIVNKDYFNQLHLIPSYMTIKTKNPEEVIRKINSISKKTSIHNIEEEKHKDRANYIALFIFLSIFIGIISLIGITNILNIVSSNMELRQREFAALKSMGMTNKELNRMIALETIFYSLKSLLFGIFLGIIGDFLMIHFFYGEYSELDINFQFPWKIILIASFSSFALIYFVTKYSISKINRKNIIETIRKENI